VLNGYFRSHPPSSERVARIRQFVAADRLDASAAARPLAIRIPR
jgi:hypothetical protein